MSEYDDGADTLRQVMSAYPTGVTVVAGIGASGLPFGLTVNSFTSVSLEPPLVLVCIGEASASHDGLVGGASFAVSVLAADQAEVAIRFAREPSEGRFDEVAWTPAPSGAPLVEGAVAWLDCAVDQVLSGGDHTILVGRVTESAVTAGPALLFHRGALSSADG